MLFLGVRRLLAASLLAVLTAFPAAAAPRARMPFWPAREPVHGPLARLPQWMSPEVAAAAKTTGLVFITDLGAASNTYGAVEIFAPGNLSKPIGQITTGVSGPLSVAVDGHGIVYVANGLGSATVTSYKPVNHVYGNVYHTYSIPNVFDPNVAVANDGTLYVTDGNTSFYEFLPGQVTPSLVGQVPASPNAIDWGITVDQSKNVYIGVDQGSNPCDRAQDGSGFATDPVYRFAPGSTTGVNMNLQGQLGMGMIAFAPGSQPNMLVAQCESPGWPSVINVFASSGGMPTRVITSPNFLGVDALAFNKAGTRLYVGNIFNNNVEELTYPGGTVVGRADGNVGGNWFGAGVAVSPPAP